MVSETNCPAALETVMPVPIRRIAENDLHLTVITDKKLSDSLEILGQVLFYPRRLTHMPNPDTSFIVSIWYLTGCSFYYVLPASKRNQKPKDRSVMTMIVKTIRLSACNMKGAPIDNRKSEYQR